MQKKGIFRAKDEQRNRFALLLDVRSILEDPDMNPAHEQRKISRAVKWQGEKIVKTSYVDYWIFTATLNDKPVKCLVRKFGEGQKHFLTLYEIDKKEKSPE